MATLIEHGDMIDIREIAETLTEKLDEWSDLSGEEQAVVRNTVDAVRSMLADLGYGHDDTTQVDRWAVETLTWCANKEPTAIAEDYFTTYAQELADDIGAVYRVRRMAGASHWEAAADELKQDYSEFDLDGHAYLIRSV